MPAVARWNPDYLATAAGGATVTVAIYPRDHRDYGAVTPRQMTLTRFLADLTSPNDSDVRYLFNNPSCVFARNEAPTMSISAGPPSSMKGWRLWPRISSCLVSSIRTNSSWPR